MGAVRESLKLMENIYGFYLVWGHMSLGCTHFKIARDNSDEVHRLRYGQGMRG